MNLLRYILFLCAFLCLCSGPLRAQLANPRATRYTVDQGVSNNIVIEFAQDKDGLLWIATYNGLNRFDGISFRTYRKNYTDANSLHSNMVSRVTVDEGNKIWIGYSDGGVSCFDQATNNFRHYLPDSTDSSAILPGAIDEIVVDRQGKVWVGIAHHGLMVLDPRTDKFEHIGPLPFVSKLRSPGGQRHYNRLSSILPDSTGVMWMGTGDGFYSFDTRTRKWRVYRMSDGPEDITQWKPDVFNTICRMGNDDFYLGGWGTGLNHYNIKTGKWKNYLINPAMPMRGTSNIINCLLPKSDHEIWVGSNDTNLCVFDTRKETFVYYTAEQLMPSQMLVKGIRALFIDRDGDMWVGHNFGMHFMNLSAPEFRFIPHAVTRSDNQDYYGISSVLDDPVSGELFLSTSYADGLNVIGKNGKTRNYPIDLVEGFEPVQYMGRLFNDSRNTLWVPTRDFLYHYDRDQSKLIKIVQPVPDTSTKGPPFFARMVEDKKGRLWIATYRHGVYMYDPATGSYKQHFRITGDSNSIASNIITGLAFDTRGKLWLGYKYDGLSRYDTETGRMEHFRTTSPGKTAILDNNVTSLCADRAGNVWVASLTGLIRIDASGDQVVVDQFVRGQDLLGLFINSVETDDDGNIWCTNLKGVSTLNPRTGQLRHFNHNNGLQTYAESNFIIRGGNGDMFICSSAGYYRFRPADIRRFRKPGKVIVTSFYTGGNEVPLRFALRENKRVELRANDNLFNMEFISINYKTPTSVIYSYRLLGVDNEWKQTLSTGNASYTHLPGGEYVFEVRAGSPEGSWSDVTRIPVFIATPFYRTTWFTTLMAVVFATAIFILYRLRIRSIEKTEALKTKFNKQLAETEMRALRAQMNPHFIFNCLNSINRYIIKNDHKTASLYLTKFAKLIRLILDNSESHEVALSQELEALKLYIDIESLRFDHKFRYEMEVDDDVDPDSISIPPMVVQPYVENAIWHGLLHKDSPGMLHVRFGTEDGLLVCTVEDNGVGREKAQDLKSKTATTRKSLGLKITSDRLNILNEKSLVKGGVTFADLVDPEGQPAGTRVTIKIPIETD